MKVDYNTHCSDHLDDIHDSNPDDSKFLCIQTVVNLLISPGLKSTAVERRQLLKIRDFRPEKTVYFISKFNNEDNTVNCYTGATVHFTLKK